MPPRPRPARPLQKYVSELRRGLGAAGGSLVSHRTGYALAVDPDGVDLNRFERLVDEAVRIRRAGEARVALEQLRQAEDLAGAPVLQGVECSFAPAAARRVDALRAHAIEEQVLARLDLGEHAAVAAELEDLSAGTGFASGSGPP